jgi:hypothetical protein
MRLKAVAGDGERGVRGGSQKSAPFSLAVLDPKEILEKGFDAGYLKVAAEMARLYCFLYLHLLRGYEEVGLLLLGA